MNYRIKKNTSESAYLQLYRYLVKDIVKGVYPYGSKLPSKRVIAEETGVSVITAMHAFNLLCEEGYAESRQRSGIFVTYKGEDFFTAGKNEPSVTVDEYFEEDSSNIKKSVRTESNTTSEQGRVKTSISYSVLTKTMRRVMLDYGEKILVKSPNHGCPELRNELCRYLARSRGIAVKPNQVVIGSGAEYLYGLIVQLLGTDRVYGIESPAYHVIEEVYSAMGAKCDRLTMGPEGIVTDELQRTKATILHVTPFNSYPTGISAGVSKKMEYLRWAKQRCGILIEDNYDSELTVSRKAEEPLFSMDREAEVIYLNTFSRTVSPSMRIGYMILPDRLSEIFDKKLGFYSCTVPIFDQYVMAELLRSGDFERHINRIRRQRRKALNQ
jgi:GntR family transcriptional regulator/MocR family aminotransferase